ncbi:hypothetical protein MKQ68_16760 [Chitinophaga horti]|uniref:Uncharacterized protein n=1 Tax=Chitinophaga horti TaxID=2920382 RepID=A0ABY6IWI7_9BACT|nr:hypothetical protein [Chitinophaga horti]UYQ91740.1 hypothetical protein MKQ68_16760 [Chitinophaga horti]
MKKAILFVMFTLGVITANAATISLYGGTPPGGTTVSIDSYNNITVNSSGSIYRIDFTRYTAPTFYSIVGPFTGNYTFNSDGAYIITIGWQLSSYPYNAYAQYYITY